MQTVQSRNQLGLRPFRETDYPRMVEIRNAIFTDYKLSDQELRHGDATWEMDKYFRLRLAAEDGSGRVLGFGQTNHMPHQFHPDRYDLNVAIDPVYQRRGVGSALYERLTTELRERGAAQVRAEAKESMPQSVAFLEHRQFREIQRYWESRLDVASFDLAAFASAEERVAKQGIAITTLADELARGQREVVLRQAYELDTEVSRDIPMPDPMTVTSFEHFQKAAIESPNFLPEGWFIAKDGDKYVGVSNLWRSHELPDVLYQGLTGVRQEYRGWGIAMALKIHGYRAARDRSIREIRTWNNTRNRSMLRINEAMGFAKQPVWIEFEKTLG